LSAKIVEGPKSGGWAAIGWMGFFFAYVAAGVLVPVFASALRRQRRGLRIGGLVLTVIVMLAPSSLSNLLRSFTDFSVTWWLGAYWIPVIWMTLCLIAAARRKGGIGAAEATPTVH
jgi:uncharacterized membrane protein YkvI